MLWRLKTFRFKLQRRAARRAINTLRERLTAEGVPEGGVAVQVVDAVREVERIEAKIDLIRTARLTKAAIKLGIFEFPPKDWLYTRQIKESWGSQSVSTLTKLGEAKMRRDIWIERRSRWEFWLKVIGIIVTGLTGLLGTLIGVLALLAKKP